MNYKKSFKISISEKRKIISIIFFNFVIKINVFQIEIKPSSHSHRNRNHVPERRKAEILIMFLTKKKLKST